MAFELLVAFLKGFLWSFYSQLIKWWESELEKKLNNKRKPLSNLIALSALNQCWWFQRWDSPGMQSTTAWNCGFMARDMLSDKRERCVLFTIKRQQFNHIQSLDSKHFSKNSLIEASFALSFTMYIVLHLQSTSWVHLHSHPHQLHVDFEISQMQKRRLCMSQRAIWYGSLSNRPSGGLLVAVWIKGVFFEKVICYQPFELGGVF